MEIIRNFELFLLIASYRSCNSCLNCNYDYWTNFCAPPWTGNLSLVIADNL